MKRRRVSILVSDHAVLRYLERQHGIDIEAVRKHLAGRAISAAELGAVSVRIENVKLMLRSRGVGQDHELVAVSTVLSGNMMSGGDADDYDG